MRSATKLIKNFKVTQCGVQQSSNVIRTASIIGLNKCTSMNNQVRQYTNVVSNTTTLFNNNTSNNIKYQRFYTSANDVVIKVPSMGDSISEGTVVAWTKNVGDSIRVDEVVCSIETDKVTIDINAPVSGTIVELYAKEGENVTVGNDLYKIAKGEVAAATPASKPVEAPKSSTPTPAAPSKPVEATKPAAPVKSTPTPSAPKATTTTTTGPSETRVKMTRIRQRTAQRLKDSQNTAASLTTFNELDMSALMNMRKTYKDEFEKKHGVKFGFMSAFVKASTIALKEQPIVNASVEENDIVYHNNVNINVAVAAPKGLVVPVIRNCESLSFAEIEKEIGRLSGLARNDELAIEDSVGGTFTISNGGVFGSMFGTPIINPPQSAILGMHGIKDRATVVNGQVVVRPIMYIALTYDHRIIDGREAVTFLKKIKDVLETPERILLDL